VSALLEVRELWKRFGNGGAGAEVHALRGVSFTVGRGETVALVGASGSGKSTLGRILLRLETADRGVVQMGGVAVPVTRRGRVAASYRRQVQMVFQDPFASLNGVNTVRYHLARPLLRHGHATRDTVDAAIERLLEAVGLGGAVDLLDRHPDALSGGQRQRVALARALAPGPELLVADEPTSMLDVSIRMGVLRLLAGLSRGRGMAILFITHDLASARFLADRVIVLHAGAIVEAGPTSQVIGDPQHPYTQRLLAATPHGVGRLV
jgi:peptide/nickel transport system ATP-binding protein